MAEEMKIEKDKILEDIEISLAEVNNNYRAGYQSGYRMTIHPDGLIEIVTGELAGRQILGNPHYSCCCCCD